MTRQKKGPSLKRRITLLVLAIQALTLVAYSAGLMVFAANVAPAGIVLPQSLTESIAKSVRYEEGRLRLEPNPALTEVQASSPGFWFIVQRTPSERIVHGAVPERMMQLADLFGQVQTVEVRNEAGPRELYARYDQYNTSVGHLDVLAGGGGFVPSWLALGFLSNVLLFIPFAALFLLSVIVVPLGIALAFKRVAHVEQQAASIDFRTRGVQLIDANAPREIRRLIAAINQALRRLDAGYEESERFFASAAHELRTPIGIIQVRVDTLPESPEKSRLRQDVARLASMANHLLDLQKFQRHGSQHSMVDLVALAEGVVTDLAERAIAAGYELALDAPYHPVMVGGDEEALHRLIINLLQNAIQHGGRRGEIIVRVTEGGAVEVQDEGPGVDPALVDRIFTPFFRAQPRGEGAGLGLALVAEIAESHGTSVQVEHVQPTGALFRVPLANFSSTGQST